MNFHNLSNMSLLSNFSNLVQQERKITAQVLECIAEIDRRKLYVEQGYSSLFDYLVKNHGYSPGAAMRRVDGARLLRELPEVKEKFENGALTLSQANQIQRAAREMKKADGYMSTVEKQELISQVEHASKKETEKIISAALDLPVMLIQKETFHQDDSVTLTMTFSKEQMEMLEQVRNMISHCVTDLSWVEIFSYLAKRELARRTNAKTQKVNVIEAVKDKDVTSNKRQAIPVSIRKALLHANAKCEYKNSHGKPCHSTHYLQIDHIKSVSRCGGNESENLQVLCGAHNRYKYITERD